MAGENGHFHPGRRQDSLRRQPAAGFPPSDGTTGMSVEMDKPPADPQNPLLELRRLTPARIALGRTGTSMPTSAQLDFQYAHAQARDAVHLPFDSAGLSAQLAERGRASLLLHSAATDRNSYLQRPDLGRKLSDGSAQTLRDYALANPGGVDLALSLIHI